MFLGEGIHFIFYRSIDKVGNVEKPNEFKIFVDSTAPLTQIEIGEPKFFYNGKAYITSNTFIALHAHDPTNNNVSSGLKYTKYAINSGVWTLYSNAFRLIGYPDNKYAIYYYSADNVENTEIIKTNNIYLDNTPPYIAHNLVAYIENSTNVSLHWTKVTNYDLAGYNIYDNGIKINNTLIIDNNYFIINEEYGEHIYQISSIDWLGNESELSEAFIVTIDNSIILIKPYLNIYYRDIALIEAQLNLEYLTSQMPNMQLIIEYGSGENPDSWQIIKQFSKLSISKKALIYNWELKEKSDPRWAHLNGKYRFRIRITNNSFIRQNSRMILIDNQEPLTSIANAVATNDKIMYLNKNVLSFNANDPLINNTASGIKTTKYKLIEGKRNLDSRNWIKWDGYPIYLEAKEYKIFYCSEDNALLGTGIESDGNKEEIHFNILIVTNILGLPNQTKQIVLGSPQAVIIEETNTNTTLEQDIISPQITVPDVENGKYYKEDICFNVKVYDENIVGYYVVFRKDGVIQLSYTGNMNTNYIICTTGEAEYELIAQANDKSGNIANLGYNIGIDKSSPVVQITGVEDGRTYYNEAQPRIEVIEDHLKNIVTNLSVSNIYNVQYTGITWNGEKITNKGKYKLQATAEDKAGNTGEKKADFELKKFSPEEVLVFKADYNTNTDADYSIGEKKDYSGGKITDNASGYEGEALKSLISGDSHYARYKAENNIKEEQGTIIMWVKPLWTAASYNNQDQGRYLFSLYETKGNTNFSINLAVFKEQGTSIYIRYNKNNDSYIHILNISTNTNENKRWYKNGDAKWTHIASSWNSKIGLIKIYVDGQLIKKINIGEFTPYYLGGNAWMKIGDANKGPFKEFNGYIDRVKIYRINLTDKQIKEIYENEYRK